MSTAIERIMRERGDLTCLHEPFMYDYYVHRKVRVIPNFKVDPEHPKAYRDIRDHIIAQAKSAPVFFKDMSYYVLPHLAADPEFARITTHSFLIRNPVSTILSYYKLDPEVTLEEIGIVSQWEHFKALTDLLGTEPVVIEAEHIQAAPKSAMSHYWKKIGLDYVDHAFRWRADKAPGDWHQVEGWHGDVLDSRGIRGADSQEAQHKREQFQQCLANAPHLADYLARHLPAYENLKNRAVA